MNLDWPELSRQLLVYGLGLASGILLTYLGYRYTRKIEEKKLERKINLQLTHHEGHSKDFFTLYVTNIGQRPVTIIEAGMLFKDGLVTGRDNWENPKRIGDGDVEIYEFILSDLNPTGRQSISDLEYVWVKNSAGEKYTITGVGSSTVLSAEADDRDLYSPNSHS